MVKSNTLKKVELTADTKIKFNVNMHGFEEGRVLEYGSLSKDKQVLVRRRFADNDGSVEIVNNKPEKQNKKRNLKTGRVPRNKEIINVSDK